MVDKYYFVKGGAERYLFELTEALQANGHEVIPFAMQHEKNHCTPYASFFVNHIEFNIQSPVARIMNSFKIMSRVIYSRHAQRKLQSLIETSKPDIAHLHIIDHQISPSILVTLKKYDIPIIQTVHQYKMICPNYRFYIEDKNEICEKCIHGKFYHAIYKKCHKHSYAASTLVAFESYIHKSLHVYDRVDLFHVPSHFMGSKLKEAGICDEKIRHEFYSINISDYLFNQNFRKYIIYFGRLSGEKGLYTLLRSMKMISNRFIDLVIVGEGPLKQELETLALRWGLSNVKFLGYQQNNKLKEMVANAKFTVVPSEWFENSPLVIYESFALGTPAIGANIGGIPELIDDQINGLLFEPGNVGDLAQKIEWLYSQPEKIREFGRNARQKAEHHFSTEKNYNTILSFYQELLNRRQ